MLASIYSSASLEEQQTMLTCPDVLESDKAWLLNQAKAFRDMTGEGGSAQADVDPNASSYAEPLAMKVGFVEVDKPLSLEAEIPAFFSIELTIFQPVTETARLLLGSPVQNLILASSSNSKNNAFLFPKNRQRNLAILVILLWYLP